MCCVYCCVYGQQPSAISRCHGAGEQKVSMSRRECVPVRASPSAFHPMLGVPAGMGMSAVAASAPTRCRPRSRIVNWCWNGCSDVPATERDATPPQVRTRRLTAPDICERSCAVIGCCAETIISNNACWCLLALEPMGMTPSLEVIYVCTTKCDDVPRADQHCFWLIKCKSKQLGKSFLK